jgi:L-amino acid N-acyltransferase YncA
MFESNARLIDFPTLTSAFLKNIKICLATGSLEEAAQCLEIYTPIVYDTTITFEIIPPTVEVKSRISTPSLSPPHLPSSLSQEFAARMMKTMEKYPWLLAYDLSTNHIVGYAYAGVFKDRAAYRSVSLNFLLSSSPP